MLSEDQKKDLREKAKDIYVSGDFLLSIMDRIDHSDSERDNTIERLSNSITELRDGLMGVINALNSTITSINSSFNTTYPTRQDILNEVTSFRDKLIVNEPGKQGILVKYIQDTIGKEGAITKINDWVSKAIWVVGIIASVTTIVTSVVVNLLPKLIAK